MGTVSAHVTDAAIADQPGLSDGRASRSAYWVLALLFAATNACHCGSAFRPLVHLVAAGIGPYAVGKISTVTGSRALGLTSMLIVLPIGTIFLIAAAQRTLRETDEMRAAWAAEDLNAARNLQVQ